MPLMLVVGTINKYPAPGPDWTVTHIDASDRGIWDPDLGRAVTIDVRADMRHLPFPDGAADRVQCWHALEHVNEQGGRDAIREFARVLRPGGILDIRVPNLEHLLTVTDLEACLPMIYGDQFAMVDAHLNAHQWGYTPGSLTRLLADHSFTSIERQPSDPRDLDLLAERA